MNITITGNLGSGKSSVCKELEQLGYTIVSAGDIFRQIAAEKQMTVIQLNEAAKKDRSIDDMLDNRSTQLGKEMDHTVFDSRLAWHFVENSFKVFLLVDTKEAARRVFDGVSRSAENYRNIDEARAGLEERADLEQERFRHLYGIDYYDAGNYDLVIESTHATPKQIAQEILRNFERYQTQPFSTKVEMNLKCLFPAQVCEKAECCEHQSEHLCMDDVISLTEKNGCYYVEHDDQRVLSAIAAGKVFAQITNIRTNPQAQDKIRKLPEKSAYMVNFSKVFR
ncbi:Cytidylate kinase [Eubacterium plexicaudatum ASF492]|uniref:Cytidylate kinase n=1 Tax=Eubacterium plexicaudatum ASF492 TaxID=1235802 RepID=N2ASL4_9FIRM|nr:Cytidylate kinase [Eubacterium plexicaudatum ASF492]